MGWYIQVYCLEGVRFPPKFEMADFLAWSCQMKQQTNKICSESQILEIGTAAYD